MNPCRLPPPNAPSLSLILADSGEPLPCLEKRLTCAAAGMGVALEVEIRKDADALGIPYSSTSAVLADGEVAFPDLPCTEEIEAWLRGRMESLTKDQA